MPVVLVLILAHGKEWADPYHQSLKDQFYANKYDLFASTPASAKMSITRYNPSIILVYGATTHDRTCDTVAIASRLRAFASLGGIVIFGGVPSAFTNPDEEDNDDNVFRTAFNLKWIVGERMQMDLYDCSGQMQNHTLRLEATYLYDVPYHSRLYRPMTANRDPDEQCAVVVQKYGAGIMGYLGAADLYCHDAKFVLVDMLRIAEELRSGKLDGQTPAEMMVGGEVWAPPGWNVDYRQPLTGELADAGRAVAAGSEGVGTCTASVHRLDGS